MASTFSLLSFVAVGIGAALGAWARWLLAVFLNSSPNQVPWGTLAANLAGGYLIGLALAMVAGHPEWPAWVRLAAVTGFLGGLTTFSTFSAETVAFIEQDRWAMALAYAGSSLGGSLLMTGLGLWTARALQG